MARGGARAKSGPPADPTSGRSERRGIKVTELPASGYDGDVPAWPLPDRAVYYFTTAEDGGKKVRVRAYDDDATEAVREREAELWEWAWRTPQAWAWSQPTYSYLLHTIAMWVRTFVLCESSEATAADKGSLHRFAEDAGLTPAGLARHGWGIKADELGEKRAERDAPATQPRRERRLREA